MVVVTKRSTIWDNFKDECFILFCVLFLISVASDDKLMQSWIPISCEDTFFHCVMISYFNYVRIWCQGNQTTRTACFAGIKNTISIIKIYMNFWIKDSILTQSMVWVEYRNKGNCPYQPRPRQIHLKPRNIAWNITIETL